MQQGRDGQPQVVVIGAGPAGLTAAVELSRRDVRATVLEGDAVVGGISRTATREGWRFDIGGHRFFTKVARVQALWHDLLPDEEFLVRPRMSRILYRGKLYDYPLRAGNALRNLGLVESARCMASYAWTHVRPPRDQSTFEGWVVARFGYRLYEHFFAHYTHKLWGVPGSELEADWAAQRIKGLSLLAAVQGALCLGGGRRHTSLIEQFHYPRLGPGQMWEAAAQRVTDTGGAVALEEKVTAVHWEPGVGATAVDTTVTGGYGSGAGSPEATRTDVGATRRLEADHVVSSMPLSSLLRALRPAPPADVLAAADGLRYRDFLTVAVVVPEDAGFPDNWIYVHEPSVEVGRVQNFGAWSPDMVHQSGMTCLGLEYFVTVGDATWERSDDDLVAQAERELAELGLVEPGRVQGGYVVRMPKAYPFYDAAYRDRVATMRDWLEEHVPNVHPVGRNGMFRYNNQDHSMMTAMLTVENILDGAGHDVWDVNVEEDYHEEAPPAPTEIDVRDAPPGAGTGVRADDRADDRSAMTGAA